MKRPLLLLTLSVITTITGSKFFTGANVNTLTVSSPNIHVIDGDTIAIGNDRYRLMGFDTPETRFAKCDAERARGDQATERLERLIRSETDVVLHIEPERDRYDRYLATLIIGGQDVGPVLISEGLARPYEGGQRQGWCS